MSNNSDTAEFQIVWNIIIIFLINHRRFPVSYHALKIEKIKSAQLKIKISHPNFPWLSSCWELQRCQL
jgi:hypothetical protein